MQLVWDAFLCVSRTLSDSRVSRFGVFFFVCAETRSACCSQGVSEHTFAARKSPHAPSVATKFVYLTSMPDSMKKATTATPIIPRSVSIVEEPGLGKP